MGTNTADRSSANSYSGKDRNLFIFGWTPQAEIWNGRFAMLGFVACLLLNLGGYNVIGDILHSIFGAD